MKLLLLSLPLTYALNIVSSNDDGWAESNVRALHSALTDAGHTVVLSAPAENKSGSGTFPAQSQSCMRLNANHPQAPKTRNPRP